MQFIKKSCFSLIALSLFSGSLYGVDNEAFTNSVVIFNTICAKCHEAECSGRLSFDEAFEVSTGHILRHYGPASGKLGLQRELFKILNYMKERCAYYPMQTSLPSTRIWEGEVLDKFSTLLARNYFIPVGNLNPGSYRVEIELKKDVKATVHLISEKFEWIVEDCYQSDSGPITIPFQIEEPGNHYFRMYPREPVRIIRFAITSGM